MFVKYSHGPGFSASVNRIFFSMGSLPTMNNNFVIFYLTIFLVPYLGVATTLYQKWYFLYMITVSPVKGQTTSFDTNIFFSDC